MGESRLDISTNCSELSNHHTSSIDTDNKDELVVVPAIVVLVAVVVVDVLPMLISLTECTFVVSLGTS
jgi:hypothetical protein